MQIGKKGVILVAITLFLIAFSKNAFAALISDNLFGNFVTFYTEKLYGWLDFFIYFLIFTSIARLTLEKKFGEKSPAVKPLYVAVGLALSISLTLWTYSNGISFLNLGPAALVLLVIALIAIGYQWFQGRQGQGGEHKAIGLGFFIGLLLLLLALLYIYPDIFGNFVPGISSRDIWFLLLLLAIILGIIWLVRRFLGFGGTPGEGGNANIPSWLKWLILAILAILAIYFLWPYLVSLLGAAWWILLIILGALLLLWLLGWLFLRWWRNRTPTPPGPGPGPTPNPIRGLRIVINPDNRGRPYTQGAGTVVTVAPDFTGGSTNLRYRWQVENYRLANETNRDQTIEIDRFTLPRDRVTRTIRLWVTDTDTRTTEVAVLDIEIERGAPTDTDIEIVRPWRSGRTETRDSGDPIELIAQLTEPDAANEIVWGFVPGVVTRNYQSRVPALTPLGTINTFSGNRTRPLTLNFTQPAGRYTIIAAALDATGAILAADGIIIQVNAAAALAIEIDSPSDGDSFGENEDFDLEPIVTSGDPVDIASYEWTIVDTTGTAIAGMPIRTETATTRIATAGAYEVRLQVTDRAGAVINAIPRRITINTAPAGVTINVDSPTGTINQGARVDFRSRTTPAATPRQYIYRWRFRRR